WALIAVFFVARGVSAQANHGAADPRAMVVSGQARFTVLTSQLIRLEWTEDKRFEDHASLVFMGLFLKSW
ncbi:MAG TPA: hypothetical protein VKS20_10495, partial [Candidatus Acidoferrales bacterium]|nr:hypothetical protein [Candidatus Acidoferrales bacterium]